jgi:ABC-type dipeptide/oligopeptide/nickel transport system permease component
VRRFRSKSGTSLPPFWLGLLAIQLFAVHLGWLPVAGFTGKWSELVLPSLTLGAAAAAIMARFTPSAFLDVLNEECISTARAKGVPERLVMWKHAFRNALIPVVTMAGLQFGFLLGGSVVVETVFAWPGLGRFMIVKESLYVRAARSIGASRNRLMFVHILPGTLSGVIVHFTLRVGTSILTASILSFLGLGAQPPTPEWGAMLAESEDYIGVADHMTLFLGIAIFLTVLFFNLFGDGLRAALDPKLK